MGFFICYVCIICFIHFIQYKAVLDEGLNILRYLIVFSLIVSLVSSGVCLKILIDRKANKSWNTIWEEYHKIE